MNFIKELETHLETFESKAKAEIASFIAYVKTKYSEPAAAVVPAPAPIAPNGELTIAQPAPVEVEAVEEAPAEAEVAPEVEEPAPVEAEEAPAETEEPAAE